MHACVDTYFLSLPFCLYLSSSPLLSSPTSHLPIPLFFHSHLSSDHQSYWFRTPQLLYSHFSPNYSLKCCFPIWSHGSQDLNIYVSGRHNLAHSTLCLHFLIQNFLFFSQNNVCWFFCTDSPHTPTALTSQSFHVLSHLWSFKKAKSSLLSICLLEHSQTPSSHPPKQNLVLLHLHLHRKPSTVESCTLQHLHHTT